MTDAITIQNPRNRGGSTGHVLAKRSVTFTEIRNQAEKIYVQDRLHEAADELRRWIDEGAALYVCGSLQGMAGGVDRVLREVLGEEALQRLADEGRYRRDVY